MEIFSEALLAVNGRRRVAAWLETRPLDGPVHLIALGKAAASMSRGALDALGDAIRGGLVITKYGHGQASGGTALPWPVREAGHPVPDAASLEAGEALWAFAGELPSRARVLLLLSGGASALAECLPPGLDRETLVRFNRWALGSGLDIRAVNGLRQRLSLIKGGRLAARLAPRPVCCLALSDVPGDDPALIGSGPVSPASGAPVPEGVPEFLRGPLAAAPPPPDPACFRQVEYHIVGRLRDAMEAAAGAARERGYTPVVHERMITGEAAVQGRALARALVEGAPGLHVWGGETTVALPPQPGRGGRNQHLALAAAGVLAGEPGCYLLSAGTDGSDGPGGDAGALVDGGTLARGREAGLDPDRALDRADAGPFLEAAGDLLRTGPTGTNVMDLLLGLKAGG